MMVMPLHLHAQFQSQTEHVVLLKNGSVLRGNIVEQVVGSHIVLRIPIDGDFTFQQHEIQKITVEANRFRRFKPKYKKAFIPYQYPEGPMFSMISGSIAFKNGEFGPEMVPNMQVEAGLHINKWFNPGLGFGISPYPPGNIFPIFLSNHGFLNYRPKSIYYHFQGGYGFATAPDPEYFEYRALWNIEASVGIAIFSAKKSAWILSVGYHAQQSFADYNVERFFFDPSGNWVELEPARITGFRLYQNIIWKLSVRI
ncbi:hypothetical protein [Pontibacter sp. G13]|uniref:hypothetical protein n=1 Tax=Pontibacter sp. G13 TaxID=3074898 RepID=UPI00288A138B|nr:hypothetical protein [Pontibacter sp. G13]WNJ16029.1 hypothetical protein RJD25_14295 [Pontibacter sp. G13]